MRASATLVGMLAGVLAWTAASGTAPAAPLTARVLTASEAQAAPAEQAVPAAPAAQAVPAAPAAQDAPTASSGASSPQMQVELPTGKEVFAWYVEALGGSDAFAKLHNRVVEGKLEVAGLGIEGSVRVSTAEGHRYRMSFEIPGLGETASGSDGKVVWENQVMTGPRILEGAERAAALRESRHNREITWQEDYAKAECTGIEEVGGTSCYRVVMTPRDEGPQETWYFDTRTHLLRQLNGAKVTPMGEVEVTAHMEDYRKVDGVLVPFRSVQEFMGQKLVMTIESVQHNVELGDDVFALPDEVESLLEGAEEEGG